MPSPSDVVEQFMSEHRSGTNTKVYFEGVVEFLLQKNIHLDPSKPNNITEKLEIASYYFPRFQVWIQSSAKGQGWLRDASSNLIYTFIRDERPEKKRSEVMTLFIADHDSVLPKKMSKITSFLNGHEDNKVMIVRITDDGDSAEVK